MTAMPRTLTLTLALAGALALAACAPAEQVPAPAPAVAPPAAAPAPAVPAATGAPKNDPAVVNFDGFGPAKFGADEESVRQSWGRPLLAGTPAEGATCYQLTMDPRPESGRGVSFLFEDGGFWGYDAASAQLVAPGVFMAGAKAADIQAKFAGRVDVQPAKYVEGGKVLVVKPEGDGDARLMFDVDAGGIVTAWRIGRPPQIWYVEGCG